MDGIRVQTAKLTRETVIPFKDEIRERDWSNKLKGKVHADKERGDVSKSINVGDEFEVLLRAAKSNKLSRIRQGLSPGAMRHS